MNKKFGRIFKDKLEYAPDALQLQGMMVHNPIDAVYQQHGWYKIVEHHPAAKAGYDEVFEGYKLDHIGKILYINYKLEKHVSGPRKISKIYLKIALAKNGLLTAFTEWLKSVDIDLGEGHSINAYDAFETCLIIDESDPLFAPYIQQAKLAFNLTDEAYDALMDQCIAV